MRMIGCILTLLVLLASASICDDLVGESINGSLRNDFEAKYLAWKVWVGNNLHSSSPGDNEEFMEIVSLGAPAVPLIIEKMEESDENFVLGGAVYRIMKKRFKESEWEEGRYGDARSVAKMYVKWWNEERANTYAKASEIYNDFLRYKKEGKLAEKEAKKKEIVDLGVDILPFLMEKADTEPEFLHDIVKLSGGKISREWTSEKRKNWLEENKGMIIPPYRTETRKEI